MAASKFVWVGLFSLALGACAAVNQAIVEIETKVSSKSTPRIDDLKTGLKLTGSDRPLYSDLYEMEARYSGGLVHLNGVQQVLDKTLMEVATAAGYPEFDGKVYVIGDPNDLHAQASKEGNIFVSLGFLRNIASQEELTNLLAHEFGHIALQHHQSDIFKDMNSRLITAMNAVSKLQQVTTALSSKGVGVQNQKLAEGFAMIEKARFVQDLVSQVASPTWNRQQELAADQLAADISSKLSHRYNKATLWLPKLAKIEESGNSDAIKINRVNLRYVQQMVAGAAAAKDDSKGFAERTEGVATQVAYAGVVKAIEYFANTHSDSKLRYKLAKQYQDKIYPDFEPVTLQNDTWAKVRSSREFNDTVDAYLLADEAVALASDPGSRKQALAVMSKAEKLRGKGHVYIWSRKADMYELLRDGNGLHASLKTGPTAGLLPLVPNFSARTKLDSLLSSSLPAEGSSEVMSLNAERSAEIKSLRNQLALPVFDNKNEKRLPNVRLLLNQSDFYAASGQPDKARAIQKEIFETYQRPGFIYPKMIVMAGSDPGLKFARVEAERLNLECALLHPEQAGVCENALAMLN